MSQLIKDILTLHSLNTTEGCSSESIINFEKNLGEIPREYKELLLLSNGISFDNYFVDIRISDQNKERLFADSNYLTLTFDHFLSIEAIQEVIDYVRSEVNDLTSYDLTSQDFFLNYMHPIAGDVVGRDLVCISKSSTQSEVYIVNWWEPGSYGRLPFPQTLIANSIADLIGIINSNGH